MKPSFLASVAAVAVFAAVSTTTVFGTVYASSTPSLVSVLRTHLENRDTSFSVRMAAPEANRLKTTFEDALQGDDYLREDFRGYTIDTVQIGSETTASFHVQYWESKAQAAWVTQQLAHIVQRITRPSMTDLQKELAIHDYIVLHVAYDQSGQSVTPYDALRKGTTVCQGYAMMAYRMLQDAHIPGYIVDGTADGQAHAWNLVKISGHWYNLDVTWDDPVPDQPGHVQYDNFNVTDAQMARTHSWSRAGLPAANTDFIHWLAGKAADGAGSGRADRQVLLRTGLYLETPAYTYNSTTGLIAALLGFHGTVMKFRYPYGSVSSALSVLPLTRAFQATYEQDGRDPTYALVTLRFS